MDRAESASQPGPAEHREHLPETVAAAATLLMEGLLFQDKMAIANMSADEVGDAITDLFDLTRTSFGLDVGNQALLRSCAGEAGHAIEHADDAAAFILARLVRELKEKYRLKSV